MPEGAGLNECRDALSRSGEKDKRFLLGYVPDNDGDRGNIVYRTAAGSVVALQAQEVLRDQAEPLQLLARLSG